MADLAIPERVIYKLNPLHEVICQLKFPRILKIDAEEPAKFQEEIRHQYPGFRDRRPGVALPPELVGVLPQQIAAQFQAAQKNFDFVSPEENWVITLSSEFLALTCRHYERWEEFKQRLSTATEALAKIYEPSYYVRVGLRYVDVINRSVLGVPGANWADLLSASVAGELAPGFVGDVVRERHVVTALQFDQPRASVTFQHGFTSVGDELCYMIDSDFYLEERVNLDAAASELEGFNVLSRLVFRSSITDELHKRLEPVPA